jgi:hypothetical protein
MKTLVIHPNDRSTDFLKGIYKDLRDKTVITGGVTKLKLRKYIENYDRTIFCGHGSPKGLFGVNQFPDGPYIIDDSMVQSLRNKANSLLIWCYSDSFVRKFRLNGFYTGLFLSETIECLSVGLEDFTIEDINESNDGFAEIVSRHIHRPPIVFYKNVLVEYGQVARTNPVARYNHSRLFLNQFEPDLFLGKVVQTL